VSGSPEMGNLDKMMLMISVHCTSDQKQALPVWDSGGLRDVSYRWVTG
jgi:hypothetical protein